MNIPPLKLSKHAAKRCKEFGLYPYDLIRMVHTAQIQSPSRGEYMAIHKPWAIVWSPRTGVIITVLQNVEGRWEHDPEWR